MPEHFRSTEGRVKKPIISKRFQPIGQFVIDYLVVKPIKEDEDVHHEASEPGLVIGEDTSDWTKLSRATKSINDSQTKLNKKHKKSKSNFKVTYAKHWESN